MTVNTLGTHEQDRSSRTAAEWLWPLLPIGVSVFFLSALIYYHLCHDAVLVQSALQSAVAGIYQLAGFAPAVLCFLLALTWSSIWFATGRLERPLGRVLRLLAMTVMLGVFLNLGDGGVTPAFHKGEIGAWFAERLVAAFGYLPSLVLVWAVTFSSLLLATDFFFSESFERLRRPTVPADAGVEVAVTDHLRGLAPHVAQSGALAPATPRWSAGSLATAAEPAIAAEPESFEASAGTSMTEATEVDAEQRRRPYFERRAERERSDPGTDGPFAPDEWVPASLDGQQIDDPEVVTGQPAESGRGTESAVGPQTLAHGEARADEVGAGEVGEDETAAAETADAGIGDDEAGVDEAEAASDESEDDGEQYVGGSAARQDTAERSPDPEREADSEEPLVSIPRPAVPPVWREATAPGQTREIEEPSGRPSGRQQDLFEAGIDEGLIQEAVELVTGTRRASATLLQRKLRIDYARALDLLGELAARGHVALEGDASQGRVLGP